MDMETEIESSKLVHHISKMLDPAYGGAFYQPLHIVYRERMPEMINCLSRCEHDFQGTLDSLDIQDSVRSDQHLFQMHFRPQFATNERPPRPDRIVADPESTGSICAELMNRVVFYGSVGSGTFGDVYAAREEAKTAGEKNKHYAVKILNHYTLVWEHERGQNATMGRWEDGKHEDIHYIPEEAVVMLLLRNSSRFPTIDSVYTHGKYQSILMSAALDYNAERDAPRAKRLGTLPKYESVTGMALVVGKKSKLSELDVQKVASQIVEAFVYLMDMNLAHDDFGQQNYVVSETLDVKLIDFGQMSYAEKEKDFIKSVSYLVPFQEYILQPQLAIEYCKPGYYIDPNNLPNVWNEDTAYIKAHNDVRDQHIWNITTVVFELLHGHCPWEEPGWNSEINSIREYARASNEKLHKRVRKMQERRTRLINEELPIEEEKFTQDAVDILRSVFQKDPRDRPTLRDLLAFPWLQGSWVEHVGFQRPGAEVTYSYA